MASEDARTTETPDSGPAAEPVDPSSPGAPREGDALAAFAERLQPSRRFYANPAGN